MRNIFFNGGVAARRAVRDRNFAAHSHKPAFARGIQLAVAVNLISLRNFLAVASDEFI